MGGHFETPRINEALEILFLNKSVLLKNTLWNSLDGPKSQKTSLVF